MEQRPNEGAASYMAEYVAVLRDHGKRMFYHGKDEKERQAGYDLLCITAGRGDDEAMYHLACIHLTGQAGDGSALTRARAMRDMERLSYRGNIQARAFLRYYCGKRYDRAMAQAGIRHTAEGPLVDYDGKPIRIKRRGLLTPVDAVLTYEGGKNVLTLSANVTFVYPEALPDAAVFERAVLTGMRDWAGEYEVFGGQRLTVRVELTAKPRLWDSVMVLPVTGAIHQMAGRFLDALPDTGNKKRIGEMLRQRRSFAASLGRWTVHKRKVIGMQCDDGRFEDEDELRHVAKHEFGHLLGLGDLYESASDGLEGVAEGRYLELDPYATGERSYYSVMCDHFGPITNNDVEMVTLAFREGREQLFQKSGKRRHQKISKALGRGN